MRFHKSVHAVYNTEYHIVRTPRYRRKLFVKWVKEYLEKLLLNLEGLDGDIEVKKVNVRVDHVPMVVVIPPRVAVAAVIKYMKSVTGRKLRERFGYMRKAEYGRGGIWSRGYCVSAVGLNEKAIVSYVGHQEREDKGQLQPELKFSE